VATASPPSRKSGEWYITHPVAVAMMVAEHRMELDLIIAALLHDIVEDTRAGLRVGWHSYFAHWELDGCVA